MSILEGITLLAGVALFLFGMTQMGDGLTKVSGSKLEPILFQLSGTPLRALLLGTGVTAVIQSSSATSVMAVGFVNSGMMSVRQAINVILGAILGTSITGWVLCLSYIEGTGSLSSILSTSTLTAAMAIAGIILHKYCKSVQKKHIGDILLGFAVLMLGMHTMSGAVSGLGEQPWFTGMMTSMKNPLLGILVGTLFTAVLQSASAAVGILQALSVTGALTFEAVLPLLMGINIGASIPVLLSAVGATARGKRAALVYLVASVLGVLGCASVFYVANAIFRFPFLSLVMNPFSTALLNTLFRLANLLMLAPLTDVIETIVTKLVPEQDDQEKKQELQLEERFLSHPPLALEHCKAAISEMAKHTQDAVRLAVGLLREFEEENYQRVVDLEALVDVYEDKLGSYLLQLNGQQLDPQQSSEVAKLLHTLSDFERISDHARNLAESSNELHEKQLVLSPGGAHDLTVLIRAVSEILHITTDAFLSGDMSRAVDVEPLEEAIDDLCDEIEKRQVERLRHRQGNITQNFVFSDLITNLERISDHCSNIALAQLRLETGEFDTHSYEDKLIKTDEYFRQKYVAFRKEYAL
ncbi:MAG: Na/Pi cotransporter family protein [Oscillospiraceae bacterium]|nr:Na/Pi cotransporter family protein [Oscillospiraceae bacterium]MBR2800636.1 Na/Pi cotransporter family protein [Oscillospiraceae bacterium]